VVEFHEEHDLSVGALCVGGVIEGVEVFLEGFYLAGSFVGYFPDVAVGSASYLFCDLEAGEDVGLDVFAH
jgi:hypothetical protein